MKDYLYLPTDGFRFDLVSPNHLAEVRPSDDEGYWTLFVASLGAGAHVDEISRPTSPLGVRTALNMFGVSPDDLSWVATPCISTPRITAQRGPKQVYFFLGGDKIKIGCSDNPIGRRAEIQLLSPIPLRLLGLLPQGDYLESDIHEQFAHLRCHGEWFRVALDLVAFIKAKAIP